MTHLVCRDTGDHYPEDAPIWRSDSGGLLDLKFEPRFDLKATAERPPTLWRYREAIPLGDRAEVVSLGEGFTPLVEVSLDGRTILAKQEQLSPTGSFKDRGASVLISKLVQLGIKRVVMDSSGNAGAAVAAYCARAGIACEIYVPESTSPAKVAQIESYGADIVKVPGSREDTARAAMKAADHAYYASHCWNPYFFHGTKTIAFEIVEQLGWRAPDVMVTPVGHGTLLIGAYIGFCELRDAGLIDRLPRLIGVQSACCAPLHAAWRAGLPEAEAVAPKRTLAEGISISNPLRSRQCLEAVRETGGQIVAVDDEEIRDALQDAGRSGLFIEPASAAALAGVKKAESLDGTIVVPLTGHGLKAVRA